jgi:hypothetical protein
VRCDSKFQQNPLGGVAVEDSFFQQTHLGSDLAEASMRYQVVDDVFILVHNSQNPSDSEWDAYLQKLERKSEDLDLVRTLVYTVKGGPNSVQRRKLNEILGGQSTRVSVVTPQTTVRLIVAALSWFNNDIKAFSPENLDSALGYLDLRNHLKTRTLQVLGNLKKQLDLK